MPSTTKKQHNFMEAIANNPSFAKKVGVKQSVGQDFAAADKGKKFKGGGMAKEDMKMDMAQDKKMVKKAVGMHDKQMHGGKKTDLETLKKGGKVMKMAKGGSASSRADGCASKGKTKGTMVAMCGGGMYKKGK
jgi:hypothetical protein